jgi:hypothetical protein
MLETVLTMEEVQIEQVCVEAYRMLVDDILARLTIRDLMCIETEAVWIVGEDEVLYEGPKKVVEGEYQCACC